MQGVVISQLRWLFREQPTDDFGIDAQIEVCEKGDVLGQLLALQIKAGASYFKEQNAGGWWFRPASKHVEYWLNHSLPVLVVLVDPADGGCYWQRVSEDSLERSRAGGWKLLIPRDQKLGSESAAALREFTKDTPDALRLRELRLAQPLMQMLNDGARLVIDVEEWVNKTSGRGRIDLGLDHENGEQPEHLASWDIWIGYTPYEQALEKFFAWASLSNHPETYEAAIEDHADWWPLLTQGHGDMHPYTAAGGGEVEYWRLELSLNQLGKSFLVVDDFVHHGAPLLTVPPAPGR